jgi:membrane-associated phospholipid phosphatase
MDTPALERSRLAAAPSAQHERLSPLDWLLHCANGLLLVGVIAARGVLSEAGWFVAGHVLLGAFVGWLSWRTDPDAPRLDALVLAHHWLPAVAVVLMYFELGVLIPALRDFDDLRYDHALQAIDVWLLGDPLAVTARVASPWLSDVLTVCYFAYYPFALLVPATLYVHGETRAFRRAAFIILLAFMLSYAGYAAVPAWGPHRVFDAYRPSALDGFGLSRSAYAWLRAVPYEPPDAFPSGHALIGLLVPALAWRWTRPLFGWILPVAVGIVSATIYLRLHYIADVLAALLLAPLCYVLGHALTRSRAHAGGVPAPAAEPAAVAVGEG